MIQLNIANLQLLAHKKAWEVPGTAETVSRSDWVQSVPTVNLFCQGIFWFVKEEQKFIPATTWAEGQMTRSLLWWTA